MRHMLPALVLLALLTPFGRATWSIVLCDTNTGEIAIGSATCLEGYDMLKTLPVVVVGVGGGVAQSAIDVGAVNRKEMFDALKAGVPVPEIIEMLKQGDILKCSRQYGIATLTPEAGGFTGGCAGQFKGSRKVVVDNLAYAIQGNVLTGEPIILKIEEAVLEAPGSLADKLLAGMLAAKEWGGDGRCSCDEQNPTDCGAPPDIPFDKTAHIGQMLVARVGDPDGVCNAFSGCASGDYWMSLNVPFAVLADPDPVDTLELMYAEFLADMGGRPDGLESTWQWDDGQVLGDGASLRTLTVQLRDVDGEPATSPVASVSVEHAEGSAGLASWLGAEVFPDGTAELLFLAGEGEGVDRFEVTFDDLTTRATLFPLPALEHRPALLADAEVLGPEGAQFDLLAPAEFAGRVFAVGLSASGSEPGQALGSVVLPLNLDRLAANVPRLVTAGALQASWVLDEQARATVGLDLPTSLMGLFEGDLVTAAAYTILPVDWVSNPVELLVQP